MIYLGWFVRDPARFAITAFLRSLDDAILAYSQSGEAVGLGVRFDADIDDGVFVFHGFHEPDDLRSVPVSGILKGSRAFDGFAPMRLVEFVRFVILGIESELVVGILFVIFWHKHPHASPFPAYKFAKRLSSYVRPVLFLHRY